MSQEWDFRLAPYYWNAGFDSSAFIDDEETDSESGGIGDYLDSGFLITGEARRGPLTIFGEYNWLELSSDVSTPGPFLDLETRLAGRMIALGAGWAFYEDGRSRVEAMGGARFWDVKVELNAAKLGKFPVSTTFTDPFVGLRGEVDLGERWELRGEGSIGGFGVGSDQQVDLAVRGSFAFRPGILGVLGYRYLHVDLGDDDPLQDLTLYGPFVALEFRF